MTASEDQAKASAARFATTQWSLVLKAGKEGTPQSREALETLCQTYWQPIYAYLHLRPRFSDLLDDPLELFDGALRRVNV